MWTRLPAALLCVLLCSACAAEVLNGVGTRVEASAGSGRARELLSVRVGDVWKPALDGLGSVHIRTSAGMHACSLERVDLLPRGLLLTGDCGEGKYEQRLMLAPEPDILNVTTRFTLTPNSTVQSVEDRYDFLPPRHTSVDKYVGPLDFVWSQNIKSEADDLIPTNAFKSPAVMLQQGDIFTAILPDVSDRHVDTEALDLDVTSAPRPWIAYGAIPSEPHGHSYFRRSVKQPLVPVAGTVVYQYSLVLSAQPSRAGYRSVVRRLWARLGHPELLQSADEQLNPLRPELASFSSWRQDAWHTYADRVYSGFDCGDRRCGSLMSLRNDHGDWAKTEPDAWFNAWFQTLRTAYGWYLYGREAHDPEIMTKAESVLTLALSSPQKQGAFSTIYLINKKQWLPGDGWASYADSYHAFSMSWTAYWMLRWAQDLTPGRRAEVLRFVKPYADFLLAKQQPSGNIPSWYLASTLAPREEFRDFSAEAGTSALLLATLGTMTGDQQYTAAAERTMGFIEREVLPRQRWFDFETFLSCARKDYDFYDSWTAQYPQNNLAEMQAVQAMLALYQATHQSHYLEEGTRMLDYLLLTQQVWNNPLFTPKLLGGFTTQNTDAEWSDARQGYAATLLADFYQETGNFEYLERAVAAARSTFAVAPWENWAHTGYRDEPGALTGFHWGTGSAMTTVELLSPSLGDALIDLDAKQGVGFDECTVTDVEVQGHRLSFQISSPQPDREFLVRFKGANASESYDVSWNGGPLQHIKGDRLRTQGLRITELASHTTRKP